MLLRLCPSSPSSPTILFTLALAAIPEDLPLPHAWASALDTLLTHDLPSPPCAHALDNASGHTVLLERATFDLVGGTIQCVWIDGRSSTHQLSQDCVNALEGVVQDVSLASIEAQREQHREMLAREQRSVPPTPPSSLSKPPSVASQTKHKRKRSSFFSMVSAILSSNTSTSSTQPPPGLISTPPTPTSDAYASSPASSVGDVRTNPSVASSSEPSHIEPGEALVRGPRSRFLRRRARSRLVDSFVRYVLPIIRAQREPYELWTLSSLLRRATMEGHVLLERAATIIERAGIRPLPALPQYDEDADLPAWPFDEETDSDADVPVEDNASGTRSSIESASVSTPRDDLDMDAVALRTITAEPEPISHEDDDPFFMATASLASKPRAQTVPRLGLPPRRHQQRITAQHIADAEVCAIGEEYRALQMHASRMRVLRGYLAAQRERVAAEERAHNLGIEHRALRRARSALAFPYPAPHPEKWTRPIRGSPLIQTVNLDDHEFVYDHEDEDVTPTEVNARDLHAGYVTEEEAAADVSAARARRRAMGMRRSRNTWDVNRRVSRRPDAPYRRAALLASAARMCSTTVPFPTVEDDNEDIDTLYPSDEALRDYQDEDEDAQNEAIAEEIEVAMRQAPLHLIEFDADDRTGMQEEEEEDSDEEDPFPDQEQLQDFPEPPTSPFSQTVALPSTEVASSDQSSGSPSPSRKRLPSLSFSLSRSMISRRSSSDSGSSSSSDEAEYAPRSWVVNAAPVTVSPPRPTPRVWTGRRAATTPMIGA